MGQLIVVGCWPNKKCELYITNCLILTLASAIATKL